MQNIIELDRAIQDDNLDEIFRMISLPDFDINRAGRCDHTPIILAISHNKPELVRVFLKMGANPCHFMQSSYNSPLTIAIEARQAEIVKILLEDPRTRDYTAFGCMNIAGNALHLAACSGDKKIVELLLESGADPAQKDYKGLMPSEYARKAGHDDLCIFLRGKEMSLERLISDKFKELHDSLSFFKEAPKTYRLMGSYGYTHKMLDAIKAMDFEAVCQMIDSGAMYNDVLCTDIGAMGSWYACENGSLEIVKILFTLGSTMTESCSGTKPRGDFFTAIGIARKNGHAEIVEYLESLKAQQIEIFREFKLEQESLAKASL